MEHMDYAYLPIVFVNGMWFEKMPLTVNNNSFFVLMQPSMGILTLPCPRVVKHSASTRRRIFTYKKLRLDESLPYLFLAAVNLHRTSLWGMVNLYLIMLIV